MLRNCILFTGSLLVLAVAVVAGVVLKLSEVPPDVDIRLTSATAHTYEPRQLAKNEIEIYEREGVVLVPGLLSISQAVHLRNSTEYTTDRVFAPSKLFGTKLYSKIFFDVWRKDPNVASLALQALPKIAAQLLPYSTNEEDQVQFRLLRDAYFQYSSGGSGCGWHVDDAAFWPTQEDTDGPTLWIALDEMSRQSGGGLALLNRTLFEESDVFPNITIQDCRQAIKMNTCMMSELHPECHAKMESSKLQWDLQPGDAIIWNRWTFHRAIPAKTTYSNLTLRRYSVRYIPYGAKAMGILHPSVVQGETFDSPYYPQVWPELIPSEQDALQHGLDFDTSLSQTLKFMAKLRIENLIAHVWPIK